VPLVSRDIIRGLSLNKLYEDLNIRVRHIEAKFHIKSARKYYLNNISVNWTPEDEESEFSFQILKSDRIESSRKYFLLCGVFCGEVCLILQPANSFSVIDLLSVYKPRNRFRREIKAVGSNGVILVTFTYRCELIVWTYIQ
jgi:hypothetical protein